MSATAMTLSPENIQVVHNIVHGIIEAQRQTALGERALYFWSSIIFMSIFVVGCLSVWRLSFIRSNGIFYGILTLSFLTCITTVSLWVQNVVQFKNIGSDIKSLNFVYEEKMRHCVSGCYIDIQAFHEDSGLIVFNHFDEIGFSWVSGDSGALRDKTKLANYLMAPMPVYLISTKHERNHDYGFIKLDGNVIYRVNMPGLMSNNYTIAPVRRRPFSFEKMPTASKSEFLDSHAILQH